MPFTAKNLATGLVISSLDAYMNKLDLRRITKRGELVCPYCESPLNIRTEFVRNGGIVRQHFFHAGKCNTLYDKSAENESIEHITAKIYVFNSLKRLYSSCKVEMECPLKMDWRERGRIADVMVTWETGYLEVNEIQLSPISIDDLDERTRDYERYGASPIWWFGPKSYNEQVTDYCLSRGINPRFIEFDSGYVRLTLP